MTARLVAFTVTVENAPDGWRPADLRNLIWTALARESAVLRIVTVEVAPAPAGEGGAA